MASGTWPSVSSSASSVRAATWFSDLASNGLASTTHRVALDVDVHARGGHHHRPAAQRRRSARPARPGGQPPPPRCRWSPRSRPPWWATCVAEDQARGGHLVAVAAPPVLGGEQVDEGGMSTRSDSAACSGSSAGGRSWPAAAGSPARPAGPRPPPWPARADGVPPSPRRRLLGAGRPADEPDRAGGSRGAARRARSSACRPSDVVPLALTLCTSRTAGPSCWCGSSGRCTPSRRRRARCRSPSTSTFCWAGLRLGLQATSVRAPAGTPSRRKLPSGLTRAYSLLGTTSTWALMRWCMLQ